MQIEPRIIDNAFLRDFPTITLDSSTGSVLSSFIRTTGPILKVRLNSQKCVTFWTFFEKSLENLFKNLYKHKKRNPWNGLCFRDDFSGIRLRRARNVFKVVL